jgi:ectoine hydroxylase-related dioxygenase (phytanoyl-CoA dioxygenase family)
MITECAPLYSQNHALNLSPDAFGELRKSDVSDLAAEELRQRLEDDGYLYLPGFFEREEILSVRGTLTKNLMRQGLLSPAHPHEDAIWNPEHRTSFEPDLARHNQALESVVYGQQIMGFYENLLAAPVIHFDYTWLRAVGPGVGTRPHCDLVYMGRGTHDLLTCWIPYGDVSLELGGLIVLEDSHKKSHLIRAYLDTDVDAYCENRPADVQKIKEGGGWSHPGWLSTNPVSLREKLGGRWLTTEWRAGDLITFKMNLVHASLDNRTDRIRLSSDTRYQRASEPVDDRWVGANPPGHSSAGKRGRIC